MEFKNKSFIFYSIFEKAISELPKDIQFQCYKALINYGLNGTYQSDNPMVNSLMIAYTDLLKRNKQLEGRILD